MSNNLRFAVITPVYNTSKYLPECLDSLLAQTYKNFVAFLIDDGSTDGSAKILDQYAAKNTHFKVIHKKNGGVSSARNLALDLIEKDGGFDFIIFLDSDDIWEPNCLAIATQYLLQSKADMLSYGIQEFNKQGIIFDKDKISHPPIIYSREEAYLFCFDNTQKKYTSSPAFSLFIGNIAFRQKTIQGMRFDTSLKMGEDQNFKFQALEKINKLVVISNKLMHYRLRKSSLSHSENFNPSDLKLFLLWLKKSESLPEACRCMMEYRVADIWWTSLRVAAARGSLDAFWPEANNILLFMQQIFVSRILQQKKYKQRFFIFSLGKTCLKLYFALRIQKPKFIKTSNYFD